MDFSIYFMDFYKIGGNMTIQKQPLFAKHMNHNDLIITQSGIVTTDDTWRQPPLHSLDSRLYFITDGAGMLVSDTEQMPLEAGYVYLAPCGMKCGFYGTDSVSKLYFHINLRYNEQDPDVFSGLKHFSRLPISVEDVQAYKELYLSQSPSDHFLLKSVLYRIVYSFIEHERDNLQETVRYSQYTTDAIAYMTAHLHAKMTVKEVAKVCLCSPNKLSAVFLEEIGQSVSSYLDDLLMSEAQNLLLYSDKSIAKISEKLGFCDQFYFSRLFKKRFGLSPLQYRKKGIAR